ncbi:hemolysin family protein [Vallitalea okinawensis]|uniref:hemolysin family protein n=1 Tax=Vallitalea okinawensis TaxID=2078660 RepID=UPI000CFD866E|nr:hemolysin family protein [Vallitalea okinawensis]
MDTKIGLQLLLIAILTCLNAFFASAEMAIVSLDKNKINKLAEGNNKKAQLLLKLLDEPSKFLATIQVGITLAGFFSSASAATGISGEFAVFLEQFNIPYSHQIAVVLITIILSYFMLVFGELFPKRLALQKTETIAMFTVKPVHYISKITMPFVKLLSASTNLLLKVFRLDQGNMDQKVSEEEIRLLIEVGREHGVINQIEKQMINSIFDFDDKLAKEVMIPRPDVFTINIATPLSNVLDEYFQDKFSRVPVYEYDNDNIIGILLLKDFLVEAREYGFENVNIRKLLHPPYFVPETKPIDELFIEMQRAKKHMAILIDEYGGFSGIATLEDLIEEVFGEINDEFDEDYHENVELIDTNTYRVNGLLTINALNKYLNLDLDTENADTISGFLMNLHGSIPSSEEDIIIEHKNIIFQIENVEDRRIEKIKLTINK